MNETEPITFKTSSEMARAVKEVMDCSLLRMMNARCVTRSNGNGKKNVTISYQGDSSDRRTLIRHIVSRYMEEGIRPPAVVSIEYIDDMEKNKQLASLPIGD
jgi:hypothetical protein